MLGFPAYFAPVLLSPSFNPHSCSINLSLSYADGTAIVETSSFQITQEDLEKWSEVVFTFTGTDACGIEITQWMIRSYKDFTQERKQQDISLKNEWCYV